MRTALTIILIAALIGVYAYFGRVTAEEIAACQKGTGWSVERCTTELMR